MTKKRSPEMRKAIREFGTFVEDAQTKRFGKKKLTYYNILSTTDKYYAKAEADRMRIHRNRLVRVTRVGGTYLIWARWKPKLEKPAKSTKTQWEQSARARKPKRAKPAKDGTKIVRCPICDSGFRTNARFADHVKRVH